MFYFQILRVPAFQPHRTGSLSPGAEAMTNDYHTDAVSSRADWVGRFLQGGVYTSALVSVSCYGCVQQKEVPDARGPPSRFRK